METPRSGDQTNRAERANPRPSKVGIANVRTTAAVAGRSLSRKILLRLLVMQPTLTLCQIASRLSIVESSLVDYATGAELMPLDVQERLAAFVETHEPRLRRVACRLRVQVAAARRYEAGEVVRHMTSPPSRW